MSFIVSTALLVITTLVVFFYDLFIARRDPVRCPICMFKQRVSKKKQSASCKKCGQVLKIGGKITEEAMIKQNEEGV